MRISKSWIVAAKDIRVFLRKRYTLYSLVVFPVIIGIGLPFVLRFIVSKLHGAGVEPLTDVMTAFAFFFEKSLEPLLATPVTDGELLLGKGIGAFIPSIGSLYIGSIVFMTLSDFVTHSALGYYYFPNWTIGIILLILMPLTAVLSVEWCVIVSSRASDPRAAQLQGYLIAIPFVVIYVSTEVGAITLNTTTIWVISGVILIADIILFFLSTRTFQREEILTKWT
jgi:ABC-type Na+ efflux pump permease subunit